MGGLLLASLHIRNFQLGAQSNSLSYFSMEVMAILGECSRVVYG